LTAAFSAVEDNYFTKELSMQTRRELFFAPFQRLAVIAEQWRAGSKSYLTDLASIALLLLPLTLSNALAILLGHAFRVA
ncbi:hypothetical protein OFN54_38750, partial [Escherichia coli]|nr:hypothetical protein [Escherichia coli]